MPVEVLLASKQATIKPVGMSLPAESVVISGPADDAPLSFQGYSKIGFHV